MLYFQKKKSMMEDDKHHGGAKCAASHNPPRGSCRVRSGLASVIARIVKDIVSAVDDFAGHADLEDLTAEGHFDGLEVP